MELGRRRGQEGKLFYEDRCEKGVPSEEAISFCSGCQLQKPTKASPCKKVNSFGRMLDYSRLPKDSEPFVQRPETGR